MTTRAKSFNYGVRVDFGGSMTADDDARLDPGESWTPEHLVLAGLCLCSLKSLEFSAKRGGATVDGLATANGVVTRRDEDGRFALVQVGVDLNVSVDPPPDDLATLLKFAEKGCFVGASLRATPTYRWTVNGERVQPAVG